MSNCAAMAARSIRCRGCAIVDNPAGLEKTGPRGPRSRAPSRRMR
jgi:hypothetical protein